MRKQPYTIPSSVRGTGVFRALAMSICCASLLAGAVSPTAALAESPKSNAPGGTVGESGLPLPRFVSLNASEVNLRTGPDQRYPIAWVYRRRGLPVEVVQEYGIWRRIRDVEGVEGWVNRHLLSSERTAYITAQIRTLYARPEAGAPAVWRVEPGVVAKIVLCEEGWCQLNVDGRTGWIRRTEIWGVYPGENFD